LLRVTIANLSVWDAETGNALVLPPGVVLEGCRTIRLDHGSGTYGMEFRAAGAVYRCPLHAFQPRTEVLETAEETSVERATSLTSSRL
jgi:hypothetical protein